jgi:hypothetical protein
MQASNKSAAAAGLTQAREEFARLANAVLDGAIGRTVRCTPRRRTVLLTVAGRVCFAKVRDGYGRAAKAEWQWLHDLPKVGIAVPEPLALLQRGRRSVLVTGAAAGRPLDAAFAEAIARGEDAAVADFVCGPVARAVAALHGSGLVYRDLYWNHVFADGLAPGSGLVFLDVERVFRPWWRLQRWQVKDLAGLASSFPGRVPLRVATRFLRVYLGSAGSGPRGRARRRRWLRLVHAKSVRIRAHVPKYG